MSSQPQINDASIAERDSATPMKRRKSFLALLFLLVAAAVVIRVFMPKPAPAPVVKQYTPQEAQTAERNISAVQKKIVGQPALVPIPPPYGAVPQNGNDAKPNIQSRDARDVVRVQLSEADLNAYAATDSQVKAALAKKGVRAVQILLSEPSNIILRAAITYKGRAANLQVAGTLVPSAKTMMGVHVSSAKIGSVPIPAGTVSAEVDKLAFDAAEPMRNSLRLVVNDVRVVNHNLILIGTRQRAEGKVRP